MGEIVVRVGRFFQEEVLRAVEMIRTYRATDADTTWAETRMLGMTRENP